MKHVERFCVLGNDAPSTNEWAFCFAFRPHQIVPEQIIIGSAYALVSLCESSQPTGSVRSDHR